MTFKDIFTGILIQVRFLTRIPVPGRAAYTAQAFAAGAAFAPLIGLLIGLISAGVYLLISLLGKHVLALFLAMSAEIASTGGLHLDGLADAFDGLFSYRERERVLAIMKDSRLGTSGAIGLFVVLMLKYISLISLSDGAVVACLISMPVISRMTIVWCAGLSTYARSNGKSPARALTELIGPVEIAISTVLAICIGAVFLSLAVLPLTLIVIAFTLVLNLYIRSRIGGITGDIIGAVIELSEVLFLISAIALEKLFAWQHLIFIQ